MRTRCIKNCWAASNKRRSAPYPQRGYWLYQRTEEGKQYRILCRKKGSVDAPEEVVLDVNKLAAGQKFMSLGAFEYSDDNALVAYSTDVNGHRDYDFHLMRLSDRSEIKTPIGKVADLTWSADSKTIFYVTEDDAKRSDKAWRYTLGDKAPTLLFEEKDELFNVGVGRTHDGKYVGIGSVSSRTTEYRFIPADQPTAEPVLIAPRRNEIEYYPEHRDGLFYIRTNDGAKEFRVVTAPVATPGVEHWQEFIPTRPGVKIEDFEPYAKYGVPWSAKPVADVPRAGFCEQQMAIIPLPEPAYDANSDHNAEFDAEVSDSATNRPSPRRACTNTASPTARKAAQAYGSARRL